MIALVFPGQGSQYIGMGLDFYKQFPLAKQAFEEASDSLKLDLTKVCFDTDAEVLNLTANAQPAILTVSVAILRVLVDEIPISADFVAGHSLGEYSALVASGVMELTDAVRVVRKRGEFMQDAVPVGVGSMAAVIGVAKSEIEEVCNEISHEGNIVSPANFNSPQQTVISGHKDAVERASKILNERGAKRVIPLSVSAPFHCTLMKVAADKLESELEPVNVNDFTMPVISNVTAKKNNDKTIVKSLLVQQVVSPVRWSESMEYLRDQGVEKFIEVGPGTVLTGLIKRILNDAILFNLEKPDQLTHIKQNENRT